MTAFGICPHTIAYRAGTNTYKLWRFVAWLRPYLTIIYAISVASLISACGAMPPIRLEVGPPGPVSVKYESYVVAGEPQAALVAQEVLLAGGNAADAATALGLSLAVTLPSSAGLGGSGACLMYDPSTESVETLDFLADENTPSAPRLAQGLFSLHAKHGSLPWSQVVSPSENLARFGHPVSRALAQDLERYGAKLFNDRPAIELFMTPARQMLRAGDQMRHLALAATLGEIRSGFANSSRYGDIENKMFQSIEEVLGGTQAAEIKPLSPTWTSAFERSDQNTRQYSFESKTTASMIQDAELSGSTEFMVADDEGTTLVCVLTMGSPFGLGVISPSMGFLLASSGADEHPNIPAFAMSLWVDLATRHVVLAAASSGPEAMPKVMRAVGRIKDNETGPNEQDDISVVYCNKASFTDRVRCQAWARPSGHGYATVIESGK